MRPHALIQKKKTSKMKFDFVTIASHQLRTPLSAMKWFLEMLLGGTAGKLTKRQHDFITEIYKSNERMIRLVNDLLMVSKIHEQSLTLIRRPFYIESLLHAVIVEMRPLTQATRITVVEKYDLKKKIRFSGDEDKLRQVLRTLIDNAMRYMIDGGLIIVKMSVANKNISVDIQDTGVGIPAKEKKKVFQQFYRGSNVVRMRTEGTGLGLSIAKAIVELSGGMLTFNSTEGKGSVFSLTLPLGLNKK